MRNTIAIVKRAVEELVDAGRRHSLLSLVLRGPLRFFHLYVIRRGFLDGVAGFVLCTVMAHYSFLKGAKLWELQTLDQPADDGARSIPFEQATRCTPGKSTTGPDQRGSVARIRHGWHAQTTAMGVHGQVTARHLTGAVRLL